MTLPAAMEVEVFKTARRPDTFLFLPEGLSPNDWPDGLEAVFMPAEKVLSLTLTADQPLAAQSATRVMEEIAAKGYFLQLPPQPSSSDASEPSPNSVLNTTIISAGAIDSTSGAGNAGANKTPPISPSITPPREVSGVANHNPVSYTHLTLPTKA